MKTKTGLIALILVLIVLSVFSAKELIKMNDEVVMSYDLENYKDHLDKTQKINPSEPRENKTGFVAGKNYVSVLPIVSNSVEDSILSKKSQNLKLGTSENDVQLIINDLKLKISKLEKRLEIETKKNKEISDRHDVAIQWFGQSILEVKDSVFTEMRRLRGLSHNP